MIPLLDTHQHLVYPDQVGYAWTDGIPALANQSFEVKEYARLTADKGIGGTIFMESGVDDTDYQSETRFVAKLAANPANNIVGMIAACHPEDNSGYDEWLEECADMPVVGYRRILHVVDDELSQTDVFRANVRKLGSRDLTFDMCFLARQLPIATELAKSCENTRLILNHCGVPDIAGGEFEPWKKDISELAECPNVVCKISGLLAYCAPGTASKDTISPYIDHVINAFGADRLVWGSDWPVVNMANGLSDWLSVTRAILDEMSNDEAEKIANGTASRIYATSI
jgi:predicted TIM-barrel fold metal-dependent hydrolase